MQTDIHDVSAQSQANPAAGYALSRAQTRLWAFQQIHPDSSVYNMPTAFRLPQGVSERQVRDTLAFLVRRHAALRTSFLPAPDGEPRQVVHENVAFDVPQLVADTAEAQLALFRDLVNQPFDLSRAPLFRAAMVTTWDRECIVFCNIHHSVCDGTSLEILRKEFEAVLVAGGNGDAAGLPALPVQYVDFAAWQNRQLREPDATTAFWRDKLRLPLPTIELPYDFPREQHSHAAGAAYRLQLTPAASASLTQLANEQGATLFIVLLTALLTVLHRLSGQRDLIVGTPVAGREHPDLQQLVGCFINTVMIRTRVDPREQFRELLQRVKHEVLGALQHQRHPFERVVEELGVGADLTRFPVSPVFLNLLSFKDGSGSVAALGHRGLDQGVKFDLGCYAYPLHEGLVIDCHYRTACFLPQTIERLMGGFELCLRALDSRTTTRRIQDFALFDRPAAAGAPVADGLSRMPFLQMRTAAPRAGRHPSVPQMFAGAVARAPEAPAVVWRDQCLSYAALDALTNRIAHALAAAGAGRGDVVAILAGNPVLQLAACLGTLKAGAVFCSLDPGHPDARLAERLELVAPRHLLLEHACAPILDRIAPRAPTLRHALWLDEPTGAGLPPDLRQHLCGTASDAPSTAQPQPDDPCYVFFTSGSTGRPKAVLGRTVGLAHFIEWEIRALALDSRTRASQLTPPTFDVYLRDVFAPLCAGATVCIPPSRSVLAPEALLAWLEDAQVTLVHCVPTVFRLLLEAPGLDAQRAPALRTIVLAGEVLPPADANAWIALFGERIALVNLYGPTETTLAKFFYRLPATPVATPFVPLGKPMPGAQAILLNADLEPCAWGEVGEIHIRTPYRSLGYLGAPEANAAAFVPSPLSGDPDDILYRTGDFALVLPDGNYRFMGRQDAQVKIRGMRVDLGEIEAALRQQAGVRQCAVVLREDVAGEKLLAAYVVPQPGAAVDADALRQALGQVLPGHMVPAHVVPVEALPLTPTGKVDRRALPAPPERAASAAHLPPRTPTERGLADIWAEVLRRDRVGLQDNFFELGGHSLLAVRVVSRARERLGARVEPRDLFETRDLAALAQRIDSQAASGAAPRLDWGGLRPVAARADYPLSHQQHYLWLIHSTMQGQQRALNMPLAVRLSGALDAAALRAALHDLAQRHSILRVHLRRDAQTGEPRQVVAGRADIELPELDASTCTLEQCAAAVAAADFDLERGPLLKGAVYRASDERSVLLLTLHHLVFDGWSISVLTEELMALYAVRRGLRAAALPALALQYTDYAAWQHTQDPQADARYWGRQLRGYEGMLPLPYDYPRTDSFAWDCQRRSCAVPEELLAQLGALARQHNVTVFTLLLAALAVVVHACTGREDLCIGTTHAGRDDARLEGMLGHFVSILPLRLKLSPALNVAGLIRQANEVALQAREHQAVPPQEVWRSGTAAGGRAKVALLQVIARHQNLPRASTADSVAATGLRLEVGPLRAPRAAKCELDFQFIGDGQQMLVGLDYASSLFAPETIERLLAGLLRTLQAMVARPHDALGVAIAASAQAAGTDEADPLLAQELAALQELSDEQVARELEQLRA